MAANNFNDIYKQIKTKDMIIDELCNIVEKISAPVKDKNDLYIQSSLSFIKEIREVQNVR